MLNKKQKQTPSAARVGLLTVALVLLLLLFVGGVWACLKWSGAVENRFTAADETNPTIHEIFDSAEKKDVSVTVGQTGYSVYVRATITVTWMNKEGKTLALVPEKDFDYSIELNLNDSGWFYNSEDGFYYYKSPVESGGSTGILITSCKPLASAPLEGYTLDVKIAAQTIQSAGTTDESNVPAVTDAWKVAVNNDKTLASPTS